MKGSTIAYAVGTITLALLSSGCATKTYGRQPMLTDYEAQTMSCREISLEEAKVNGYLQQVHQESQFDGRSVLSFLGDFGIGNEIERSSAIDTANKRMGALRATAASKHCDSVLANTNVVTPASPASPSSLGPASSSATPSHPADYTSMVLSAQKLSTKMGCGDVHATGGATFEAQCSAYSVVIDCTDGSCHPSRTVNN
ncbi:hypothetical protein [Dyella solisilvae]|uniref:hypothetical protein n=1 Tax=Dyella solisilvae TaxID=1920168 RepID=UPI0018F7C20D|nr:hypothetical protein [Dyella solisilvae]